MINDDGDSSDDYLNPLLRGSDSAQDRSRQYPPSFPNFNHTSYHQSLPVTPQLQYSASVENYRPSYQQQATIQDPYSPAPFQGAIDERSRVYGTCYTPQECEQRGGEQVKHCAAGFGSCCVCKIFTPCR